MKRFKFFPITLWIMIVILHSSVQAQSTLSTSSTNEARTKTTSYEMSSLIEKADAHFQKTKSGYKQYKRMEEYLMSRIGPDGKTVNIAAMNLKAYNDYMKTENSSSRSFAFAHNGSWEFLGPVATTGEIGGQGRVNRFAFHPTDPNIIYAATAGGGLWKSIDKGTYWFPKSDGLPLMNTTGIAIDFVDPDILYLLSGDGDGVGSFYGFNEFTRTSVGVFKSTDEGITWHPTGLIFDEETKIAAYNLYMNPQDRMMLYACTGLGLFRTTDGGITWDTLHSGGIFEMEFKPGDPDRIYCVDRNYCYVSDDGGDTWMDSTLIPLIDDSDGRMAIATCQSNPNLVYLLATPIDTLTTTDTLPDMRGFWVSTNSGEDFTLVATRPNLLAGGSGIEFKNQAYYDFDVECNPLDPQEIFVSTIGMWKSPDGGVTWISDGGINSAYHADIHCVKVNPLDQTIYLGTDGGVFKSTDMGTTYEFASAYLACTQYYKISTSPFDTDVLLVGAQDNGVHLRYDDGPEFDRVIYGDGMKTLFHPFDESLVVASRESGRIYKSLNAGESFDEVLPPPKGGDTAVWTTLLAFDADDPDVIYVGYKPIMKSTDQGSTFSPISADTISAHKILENNLSNPSRLYAGDCRNCGNDNIHFDMYTSPDAGDSWEKIDGNPNFPETSFVTDATINPDNSGEIWITCGRYEADKKIYRSLDTGDTWSNETGSLPNVPVNAIVYEDNNGVPSGAVYIATDVGVFYRNDDLEDWIYFSNNLPRVEVTDLDIDYLGGNLRASTYGRGVWQSELYTNCQPTIFLTALNQAVGQSYNHHALDNIFSTAIVDGYKSQVIYKCEEQIHLTTGFHATSHNGATFFSLLAPCGEGGIVIPLIGETNQSRGNRE